MKINWMLIMHKYWEGNRSSIEMIKIVFNTLIEKEMCFRIP